MDLSRVIVGPIVTEKAERLKGDRTYTLKVMPRATKVDVRAALKRYYDVDAVSVRVMRVMPKFRPFGRGNTMRKRQPYKKVLVTLAPKSKPLDVASLKT